MPEPVSAAQRRFLVWFAWGVWAYRLMLFLGIALVVYEFFFKFLGLILFAVEIGWFIVLPVVGELKIWWSLRGAMRERRRGWLSVGGLACVMAALFVPWSDRISLPAVLESTPHATIYAPAPGRIVELAVKEGRRVGVGDRLVTLESPVLERDMALTRKRIEVERLRGRRQFIDRQELAKHQVTLETLKARLSQLEGLLEQQQNLVTHGADCRSGDRSGGGAACGTVDQQGVAARIRDRSGGRRVTRAGSRDRGRLSPRGSIGSIHSSGCGSAEFGGAGGRDS